VLNGILSEVGLCEVSDGIFSVIPEHQRFSDYDDKVGFYDAIVGNRFYNRLIWGNWPSNYNEFLQNSLNLTSSRYVLDAGCGSLVFTGKAYAESKNASIILLDRSLGMLQKARKRLINLCGGIPEHITLIQGDIFNLPFENDFFDLVVSQGLIHMFDDKAAVLTELERVKRKDGIVSFTSLVGNNRLGYQYLSALKKSGEVATVHSSESLSNVIGALPFKYDVVSVGNMLYAKSA